MYSVQGYNMTIIRWTIVVKIPGSCPQHRFSFKLLFPPQYPFDGNLIFISFLISKFLKYLNLLTWYNLHDRCNQLLICSTIHCHQKIIGVTISSCMSWHSLLKDVLFYQSKHVRFDFCMTVTRNWCELLNIFPQKY